MAAKAIMDIIETPVSPELVKGQVTEDKIGPYELHDFFLWNFIMNEMGSKDLLKAAEAYFSGVFAPDVISRTLGIFLRRFFTQAFKRNCHPDGIKVFPFELSLHGWWIPSDLGVVKI
jgi:NAD+ synthase (glutamine-hydrolysing)